MVHEGNKQLESLDSIELLRGILESQQSRSVTYQEATDIGESLLTFYEILGGEAADG